jgi:hypothetical protein
MFTNSPFALVHCIVRCTVAPILLLGLLGCGDSGPLTKQVQGIVTFEGGPPPKPGKITLAPIDAADGLPRRPASGDFDESGSFTLTTFEDDDGIIPGHYSANILCWREQPTLATRHSANYVPPGFQPELTIDADADEPVELRIDVTSVQRGQKK